MFTTTEMELGSSSSEYAGATGAASTTGEVVGVGVGVGVGKDVREVDGLMVGVGMGAVPQPVNSNIPNMSRPRLARKELIIASE